VSPTGAPHPYSEISSLLERQLDPVLSARRTAAPLAERLAARTRQEQDFVVRLYTAVAAPEHDLVRTPACALVTPEQLPSWLALLPTQRGLSSSRRDRLARMLEGVDGNW